MPWKKAEIQLPFLSELVSIVKLLKSAGANAETALNTVITGLETAETLYLAQADPFYFLFNTLITELEEFIVDTFGTGVYVLPVLPTRVGYDVTETIEGTIAQSEKKSSRSKNVSKSDGTQGKRVYGSNNSVFEQDKVVVDKKNSTWTFNQGIPLLTPSQIIDKMVESFDDPDDIERPQFSDGAEVAAFGIIATAPDISGFVSLVDPLIKLLDIKPFVDYLSKVRRIAGLPDEQNTDRDAGTPPNWDSWTLADLNEGSLRAARDTILSFLNLARGYVASADQAIIELLDVTRKKAESLLSLIEQFNDLIALVSQALTASGVYSFYVNGIGGNDLIKRDLRDFGVWVSYSSPNLLSEGEAVRFKDGGATGVIRSIDGDVISVSLDGGDNVNTDVNQIEVSKSLRDLTKSGYSIGVLFVGGGPSLESVKLIYSLLIDTVQTIKDVGLTANEEKIITFSDIPDSGIWRITFNYQDSVYETPNIKFSDRANRIQSALLNTSKVSGSGSDQSPVFSDLKVSGDYQNGYTVRFQGVDGKKNQPDFIFNSLGNDEVQRIFALCNSGSNIPDGGSFKLVWNSSTTSSLGFNSTASDIQNALNGLDSGRNEIQKLSFSETPNSGTFKLKFKTEITSDLDSTLTDVSLKAALESLSNIDNVSVSGSLASGFTITFDGASVEKTHHEDMLVINDNMVKIETIPGKSEIQKLEFDSEVVEGNFRLSYQTNETTDLPYNATSTQIKTALELLAGVGTVSVSGDMTNGFQITFSDEEAKDLLSVTTNTLKTNEVVRFTIPVNKNPVDLTGKYITIESPTTSYALWFEVDSVGTAPTLPGKTLVKVVLTSSDNIAQIALAIGVAVDSIGEFSRSLAGSQITISNNDSGIVTDATIGDTDFGLTIVRQGTDVINPTITEIQNGELPTSSETNVSVAVGIVTEGRPASTGIIVSGNFSTGFVITFSEYWGKKPVSEIAIAENSLLCGVNPIGLITEVVESGRYPGNTLKAGDRDITILSQTITQGKSA